MQKGDLNKTALRSHPRTNAPQKIHITSIEQHSPEEHL